MRTTFAGRAAVLAAVWVVCTVLAALSPVTALRIAALVVFVIVLPLTAGYLVQRRVFGASSMLDLRVGATVATTLLLLLVVGAVFLGFGIPLDRWALVVAVGLLSAALVVADRWLPQAAVDPIDAGAAQDAAAEHDATDAGTVETPPPAPRRRPGGAALAAYGVTALCVAAAIVITVVSQSHYDHRTDYTGLAVQQTAASGGLRTFRLTVNSHDTHERRFVLRVRVTGRPTRVLDVPLPPGATWTRRVSVPKTSSLSAVLALRSTPSVAYRQVSVGHGG